MSNYCFTCGGTYDPRYVTVACPECGKIYSKSNKDLISEEEKDTLEILSEKTLIPKYYLENEWNVDTLKDYNPNYLNLANFEHYYKTLEAVHNVFASGRLPRSSLLVIAPPRMSKTTWAFSCMNIALEKGFKVAPLLDTMEIKKLFIASTVNFKYRLPNGMTEDDYINSPVLFATVEKTDYVGESYSILLQLLDKRNRRGLPTIIISDFTVKEITYRDARGHFNRLIKEERGKNMYKYLSICTFSENLC